VSDIKTCAWCSNFCYKNKLKIFKKSLRNIKNRSIPEDIQKFYPKLRIFRTETSGFSNWNFGFYESKLRVFRPKLQVFEPKLRIFRTEISDLLKPKFRVFKTKVVSFAKVFLSSRNFGCWFLDFLRPKLLNIKSIRSFDWAETGEIIEFRLSENRRNSRSFGRKWITVYSFLK
jgi:hypothetical protein